MKQIDMTEYTVTSGKFPKDFGGFTFAMLSDLHSNVYHIDLHQLNAMIRDAAPDAVLIVGDMINDSRRDNILDVTNYLITLASKYPTFYALGNHEYNLLRNAAYYGHRFESFRQVLCEAGVTFLQDETVYLDKDEVRLALSGVMIDSIFYQANPPIMGPGLMDKHLGICNTSYFNLLLAHHPIYFDRYAEWGADLTLSGHQHGGIIRTKRGGMISTTGQLFPYFDEGMYESEDHRTMILGRGLGTHTVKIRINNHPELVIVKLKPEEEQDNNYGN